MKFMCKKQISKHLQLNKSSLLLLFFFLLSSIAFAQQIKVSGTIVDNDNENMIGVTIVEKGTTNGTVTDLEGKYSLTLRTNNPSIRISSIGYFTQEIEVGDQSTINVTLLEDLELLDEVVVTGYGVQKRSDLTGAVSSVSAEKLSSVPIPSVEHALQGMAAGVNIIPKSGKPGEEAVIQIRGVSSVNGSKPLIIIDGVSGELRDLNPSDISSIEVLKDASAAAIYGATGGNGVILVTTKVGQAGKMKVSANVYRGIENPINKVDMMDAQQYYEIVEELDGRGKTPRNYQRDTLRTYDWQDIIFQETVSENYDVSISGGNEVSTFLFSSSLNKQNGIVKNTDYQRFTMRMNSTHKVNKHITFDEKITFVNSTSEGIDQWAWHNFYNNPIVGVLTADPTTPAYDENGDWTISPTNVGNPIVPLDMKDKINKNNSITGNFGLKINLLKGLDFQSRITGKMSFNDSKEYQAIYWASPTVFNDQDKLIMNMNKGMSYNFQNYINYQTTIAQNHNISAMIGMEANKWWGYDIRGTRVDMASSEPNMLYFSKSTNGDADIQNVDGSGYIGANQAYFGRINYDYMGKYLLTVNVRRDGSSNFGPNYRWGTFPSFSFGWKFMEEEFMNDVSFISTGKIRFGYGQTGANAQNGFPYLPLVITKPEFRYTVDGAVTQVGTAPDQISNPDLHWESVNMSNLGLDMTFLDNRISLSADVFNKVNDGMILPVETSVIAGTHGGQNPEVNFGSISNKGFELTLGARKNTGDLTGSVDFNVSGVKNEVLNLAVDSMQSGSVHNVSPTNMTLEGQPIAQFYGFVIDGMFSEDDPTIVDGKRTIITNQVYYTKDDGEIVYAQKNAKPGDARFKDVSGDGKITADDKTLLGSPLPKLTFGFSVNLQYKGFDFIAFFNGTYGNKIMNGSKQYMFNPVGYQNRGAAFADRYRDEIIKDGVVVVNENHDTDVYRINADTYTRMSNFFVEDGSYLRLRNVTLGYTIPGKITEKVGLEKLRLYAGGKNLLTFTKYTGLNPEVGGLDGDDTFQTLTMGVDIGLYPVTKMIYFGANIVF